MSDLIVILNAENDRLRAVNADLLAACRGLLAKESELTTGALYLEFRAIEAAIQPVKEVGK